MSDDTTSKGLIKYTSRDYNALLEEFYNMVPQLTELWKPDADSDPGVVLGKYIASVADMLGVNLDYVANEIYAPSVKQRKNAEKIFGLIGYTLGWYTAATTEVTFTNNTEGAVTLDFGFNGSNWSTVNAYTDITNQSRTLTYNILPMTNSYGASQSRSIRSVITQNTDVFDSSDKVTLQSGESCTRIGIEGDLRSYTISVSDLKANNYVVTLPSQHVDTTCVWMFATADDENSTVLNTRWIQVETTAEFIVPEPRFAVTYDNYSNAQITVSNYLNQMDNYDGNSLSIYWIDCSGTIGCVGQDVLTNFVPAVTQPTTISDGDIEISNLSNTVELPNTYTVTGDSPETAREAYLNSRNYINTWDSLVTLPDYTRFLRREPGVDCGIVIDCQKAKEINLAIYNDTSLTDAQKAKKYITNEDFPAGSNVIDWGSVLNLGFDPNDPQQFVFSTNFQTYTAMCFAIHNDFNSSVYGKSQISEPEYKSKVQFLQYKPPQLFVENVINDYAPLQAMSVDVQFGYARIFRFTVVGTVYTSKPISSSVATSLVSKIKEALALYYAPAARTFGSLPTLTEVVDIVEGSSDMIKYFDAGSISSDCISWKNCDIEYFNYISFAKYLSNVDGDIQIASSCIISE